MVGAVLGGGGSLFRGVGGPQGWTEGNLASVGRHHGQGQAVLAPGSAKHRFPSELMEETQFGYTSNLPHQIPIPVLLDVFFPVLIDRVCFRGC